MKKYRSSGKYGNKSTPTLNKKYFIEFKERVRYSETDQMGVAHNKNYFEWFEIARTEYCRKKNIPYKDIEARGYYLVVAESFCRYRLPLRYDEEFIIRVWTEEIKPKKVIFVYELLTEEEKNLIASGYTVHVVTNSKAQVCSLPEEILGKFKS
jgi:acyl-CoA thioester hydrolase